MPTPRGWRTGTEQIGPAESMMGDGPRGPDQRGILEILGAGSLSISPVGTFLRQAETHSLRVRGLMEQDRPGQTRVPEPQVLR